VSTYLLVTIALAASLLQAAPEDVRVVGTPLASRDIVRIRELASGLAGGPPWLLVGELGQVTGSASVAAMGPATQSGAEIRRGTLVRLSGVDSSSDAPRSWSVYDSQAYAQVAIAGRTFGEIRGEDDPNLPFRVTGTFTDEDLIEVVRFVRSTPPGPGGSSLGLKVERHPIQAISRFRRTAGTDVRVGVQVTLRLANLHWLLLEIERDGTRLVVARATPVIA
jgi:hypothetical protein